MKDEILNLLTMQDILNKYGIQIKKSMCHCPFHKDDSPSMKAYDKSFYCFSCNRTGDLIEFVKQYFKLKFPQAMEKINYDFNLGLKTKGKISKQQLKQLQQEIKLKKQKEEYDKRINVEKFIKAANCYRIYNKMIFDLKQEINKYNWEEKVEVIAFLQDKIELLDWYIEDLQRKS